MPVLALELMSHTVQGFFWLASVICFVLAFVAWPDTGKFTMTSLGFALWVFPFMWNAFAAGGS